MWSKCISANFFSFKNIFQGRCVEEWDSEFGTVLANLNETWETTFIPKQEITSSSANILRYLPEYF